jgi:hypothetical protein
MTASVLPFPDREFPPRGDGPPVEVLDGALRWLRQELERSLAMTSGQRGRLEVMCDCICDLMDEVLLGADR